MSAKTHNIARIFQSCCLAYSLIHAMLGFQVPVGGKKRKKRKLVYVFKPATSGYGQYVINTVGIKYSLSG